MLKRKDLINRLSERGYTKSTSEKMIVDLFDVVSEALASGEDVRVQGFGAFELVTLKETRRIDHSIDRGCPVVLAISQSSITSVQLIGNDEL